MNDQLPPNSPEAEQALLGCILLNPIQCMSECVERLRGDQDVFFDLRNREIYSVIARMFNCGEAIDQVSLYERLKEFSEFQNDDTYAYIFNLPEKTPSSANLPVYLDILIEKHTLRRMLKICVKSADRIFNCHDDVTGLIDSIERDVLSIRRISSDQIKSAQQLMPSVVGRIEELHMAKGGLTGISTGFIDIDQKTGGLHPGEVTVVAAYTSIGKTSFAMNIAEHVACKGKLPVGVFSLEMTARDLLIRCLCSTGMVNLLHIRNGQLVDEEVSNIDSARRRLSTAPIYFEDGSDLSVFELRSKARRMAQQFGIKLLVIDYLQLVTAQVPGRKTESRQEEVAAVSRNIKSMAMELKIPVIALSQLNDDGQLRESRAIGQDADTVAILERAGARDDTKDYEHMKFVIRKQRNGPTGPVDLMFLKPYTRFDNYSSVG